MGLALGLSVLTMAGMSCHATKGARMGKASATDENVKLVLRLDRAFDGKKDHFRVPHSDDLSISEAITVEAVIDTQESRAEGLQTLVSKWSPLETLNTFAAYEAGNTSGLDSKGYLGAVFDGRYVYYVPQANKTTQADGQHRHGIALRYDTHAGFKDESSWEAYDASNTSGLATRGYYGAVFDGRYVYYVPRFDGATVHSRALRFDTRGNFTDKTSWRAYDVGLPVSHQSAGFDGRYIYMAPGSGADERGHRTILRYDVHGEFDHGASWTTYDCANTSGLKTENFDGVIFDGRYIYFVPLSHGDVLRYDTQRDFHDAKSWTAFDATPLKMQSCVGAVFDGTYVYFVPYSHTVVVRYDTRNDFVDLSSWTSYDAAGTDGLDTKGYDGAFFDGKYVYFVPFYRGGGYGKELFHGIVLRYDATKKFADRKSWRAFDAGHTDGLDSVGFNGGAFDGRFLYFAPWNRGEAEGANIQGHGTALRYDTLGRNASFSLRFVDCGHNGGLCAAVPGPRFLVNTDRGVLSVAAHRMPGPGRHYIVGVYDGRKIQLYMDGVLVNERSGAGRIVTNQVDLSIGRVLDGLGYFKGVIREIRVSDRARSAEWIAERWRACSALPDVAEGNAKP